MSDHRTGSPDRRHDGRKADEVAGAGAAATRPSLLGSGAGVTVRYGSFGRFRVRRAPGSADAEAVRRPPPLPPRRRRRRGARRPPGRPDLGAARRRRVVDPQGRRERRRGPARRRPTASSRRRPAIWRRAGDAIDLGEVRMRSGKAVHGWGDRGRPRPGRLHSMIVEIEWPPRSGHAPPGPRDRPRRVGRPGRGPTPPQPRPGRVRRPAVPGPRARELTAGFRPDSKLRAAPLVSAVRLSFPPKGVRRSPVGPGVPGTPPRWYRAERMIRGHVGIVTGLLT